MTDLTTPGTPPVNTRTGAGVPVNEAPGDSRKITAVIHSKNGIERIPIVFGPGDFLDKIMFELPGGQVFEIQSLDRALIVRAKNPPVLIQPIDRNTLRIMDGDSL